MSGGEKMGVLLLGKGYREIVFTPSGVFFLFYAEAGNFCQVKREKKKKQGTRTDIKLSGKFPESKGQSRDKAAKPTGYRSETW